MFYFCQVLITTVKILTQPQTFFDVFLTVHLSIILVTEQFNAQILVL